MCPDCTRPLAQAAVHLDDTQPHTHSNQAVLGQHPHLVARVQNCPHPLTTCFLKMKSLTRSTASLIPVCIPSYPRKCKYACNLFCFNTLPIFPLSDTIPFKGLNHQIRIKIFLSIHHDKKKKKKILHSKWCKL